MDKDERVVNLLEELVAWTRFTARDGLMSLLNEVLSNQKHLIAYEATDGSQTQIQVGDAAGLSQQAVSKLWHRWRLLGIARETDGKVIHLVRPSEIGMPTGKFDRSASGDRTAIGLEDSVSSDD